MLLEIPKLPWMRTDDHLTTCRHVDYSNEYNKKYKNHPLNPLMKEFASDSMVKFLYGSNSQEATLPKGQNGDTYIMVQSRFKNCDLLTLQTTTTSETLMINLAVKRETRSFATSTQNKV